MAFRHNESSCNASSAARLERSAKVSSASRCCLVTSRASGTGILVNGGTPHRMRQKLRPHLKKAVAHSLRKLSHSMRSTLMLCDNIVLVLSKIYMSEQCEFEICSHYPLCYCITLYTTYVGHPCLVSLSSLNLQFKEFLVFICHRHCKHAVMFYIILSIIIHAKRAKY